ncbi:MAG: VOC family protein [Roseobacter sp.]
MPIQKLDHVNLRTARLDRMITWYAEVLQLRPGARPDFPFAGAWLYAGDVAVVHLVETEDKDAVGGEAALKLEHFAFSATDLAGFEARLERLQVDYKRSDSRITGLVAFNIWDPDGNHIHVDFTPGV